jgi:energy-coupling factor transporter ATP-binding protein EcfA2
MKIAVLVVAGILVLVVKLYTDEKKYKKRLQGQLLNAWGRERNEEPYGQEKLKEIETYYRSRKDTRDIDDITWNDLDMDRVYQKMNHTYSAMGQEYLYALLRKPEFAEDVLEERERLISLLGQQQQTRLLLQTKLCSIGKPWKFSVYRYLSSVEALKGESSVRSVVQFAALVVCAVLCGFYPSWMILPTALVAVVNMVTYYRRKAEMDQYYCLFSYIVHMVHFSKDVAKMNVDGMQDYFEELGSEAEKFNAFCRNSWLVVGGGNMDGNIADALMDYVRLLTHIDIIKFQSMAKEALRLEKSLIRMYEIVGLLDSMAAVASYRAMVEQYCVPRLCETKDGRYELTAEQLYHPLLSSPVKNSITTHRSVLLTGSNASGKSTFLKTVAINAILAQTVHTVLADVYQGNFFRIYSSMALRDDIMSRESYYMVEIKSLKRIVDQAGQQGVPVLCFIDEVLRGTNTLERIAASTEILYRMAKANALCFAATHDIELTTLLEECYENYHFQEQVGEEDVVFDYRLRKGKAMTRNAIRLLQMMGYDEEIVKNARERADFFLEKGFWK